MAVPFNGKTFTFTQPDETTLQVRGFGNNRDAVFETLDGYTIERDPQTGYYAYAKLSPDRTALASTGVPVGAVDPARLGLSKGVRAERSNLEGVGDGGSPGRLGKSRWEVRRDEARPGGLESPFPAPPARKTLGDYVGLCIPVQFPDVPGTITRAQIDQFCNQQGYTGFGNSGSVRDYFRDVSLGKVNYSNLVTEYYTAKNNRAYYTNRNISYGARAQELIREALVFLQGQGFDFSTLSTDSGGFVYALNIFYAGNTVNSWSEGLWPHQSSLGPTFSLGGGRKIADYQITNIGQELSLGTFCHENGHMLCDFPDLYDYAQDNFQSSGIGGYCLMCAGANLDEKNPTQVSAYLKRKAGWAGKVTVLSNGLQASAPSDGNEYFLHAKSATEYFLVENRRRAGRDASLPAEGLAIWHVDEAGNNDRQNMTSALHFECSLVQADNRFDLEHGNGQGDPGDLFSAATRTSFSDTTQPGSHWWDGSSSGLDLNGIGAVGPVVSFRVGSAPVTVGAVQGASSAAVDIPDNDAQGVSQAIQLAGAGAATVAGVTVTVDITHSYRGDLRVELVAPSGATVRLHDRAGGSKKDLKETYSATTTPGLAAFNGLPIDGNWTLRVQDLAKADVGKLNRWEISVTPSAPVVETMLVDLEAKPGLVIPDNAPPGVTSSLSVSSTKRVKELRIETDITHTWVGDLRVSLVSPKGTRVHLHEGTGGDADNLIKTFDQTSTPGLATLTGEPAAGAWVLEVSDRAAKDTGKLNRWRLVIALKA